MNKNIPDDIFKPQGLAPMVGRSILIMTADKVEDTEFFYPYYRFIEEGLKVDVVTPKGGEFKGKNGSGLKNTKKISDINPSQYDLLYIPGGKAPEKLKKEDDALAVVKAFVALRKPIASICHGPQVLAEAGVIKGHKIAAWPEIEDELTKAGATFVNQETIRDGLFTTARWPGDLPIFTAKVLSVLRGTSSGDTANKNAPSQNVA